MLGIPPSFEPNTPCEPQWFPRCISDSIESSADLLERLEEDRKRRLRSIANVSARTPIGLGGVEDRGPGSAHSPKPKSGNNNDYSKYRYYPPSTESAAELHTSYTTNERLSTTTPASVTMRRKSKSPSREARIYNGIPDVSMGRRVPPPDFTSPRLDPRGGGGGYIRASRPRPVYHYQRQSLSGEMSSYNIDTSERSLSLSHIDTAATPTAEEEYITPPAGIHQTPGHGAGNDVCSQRRETGQRRRRGWDEMNI